MAASCGTPDLRSLDPLFECPVCLDPFRDPRILPACGHHFCCKCLEGLAASHPHDSIICPTCRTVSELTAGVTIATLPKPVTVNELQAALAGLQGKTPWEDGLDTPSVSRPCDPCGSRTPASFFCYQCKETLCEECHTTHTQASVFTGHQIVDINTVVFCNIHSNQATTAYCHDCNQTICTRCVMGAHAKHHMDDVKTAAAKCRAKLQEVLHQRIALTVDQTLLASVEEKTGYIKQGYNESRQQISAAKEMVKDCARKLRALEAELEGRYSDNVRKLGEYKSSIKAYVRQNTRMVDLANRLVTEGSDTEVLTKGRDISAVQGFKDTLALQVPTLAENPAKIAPTLTPLLEALQINYHTETIGSVIRRQMSSTKDPLSGSAAVRPKSMKSRSSSPPETSQAVAAIASSLPSPLSSVFNSSPAPKEQGEIVPLPDGWDSMKGLGRGKKKSVLVVNVKPGTSENAAVLKRLLSTSDGKVQGIIKIERIQNLHLYTEYLATKDRIMQQNQGTVVEKRLWFEANQATAKRVNKHGFGEPGGTPLHFSSRASHQCVLEPSIKVPGQKHIYSVLVLTGKAVKEGQQWSDPNHNSLVDSESNPSLYTVVNHTQAYPEYLITYIGRTVFDIT